MSPSTGSRNLGGRFESSLPRLCGHQVSRAVTSPSKEPTGCAQQGFIGPRTDPCSSLPGNACPSRPQKTLADANSRETGPCPKHAALASGMQVRVLGIVLCTCTAFGGPGGAGEGRLRAKGRQSYRLGHWGWGSRESFSAASRVSSGQSRDRSRKLLSLMLFQEGEGWFPRAGDP